jgi:hypothetical protein
MDRFWIWVRIFAAAFVGAGLVFGFPSRSVANRSLFEREARSTVAQFFASINARNFDKTCDLFSKRFYRAHRFRDKALCVLTLKIGFTWEPSYRFQIVGVKIDGDRAIVRALADGFPGRLVLVREVGRYKILAVRSS